MLACALLSFVSAAGLSVEGLRAQVAGKVQTAAPTVPTIASMSQALLQQDYTSVQLRRFRTCLLYTSPSPRDQRGSRMPSSA